MNNLSLNVNLEDTVSTKQITELNIAFLSELTTFVAKCTKDKFKKHLEDEGRLRFIQELEKPLTDNMGRSTFFKVTQGSLNVPVYQPGTPGFYSSFKDDTPLSIVRDGSQVNGAIVGNGCADFISKCMDKLTEIHKIRMEVKHDYNVQTSFIDAINTLSEENTCHCGRFAEYVPFVWDMISDEHKINLMGNDQKVFETKDIQVILDKRRQYLSFDTVNQFFEVGKFFFCLSIRV